MLSLHSILLLYMTFRAENFYTIQPQKPRSITSKCDGTNKDCNDFAPGKKPAPDDTQ